MNQALLAVFSIGLSALAAVAPAAADTPYHLVIENHRFQPTELTVPAGKRIEIAVENRDPTVEEFESLDLRREKIIPGHSTGTVWVGPLPAGEYGFFGDFHQSTATGKLIAK